MIVNATKQLCRMRDMEADVQREVTADYGVINMVAFNRLVAGKISPTPASPLTEVTATIGQMTADGITLRIPAGGIATLTVSELGDWVYKAAQASFALPGGQMALPLTLTGNFPGQDFYFGSYDLKFVQPTFINTLMMRYSSRPHPVSAKPRTFTYSYVDIESDGPFPPISVPDPLQYNRHGLLDKYLGATVSKLSWHCGYDPEADPIVTAILPNAAEMLSIATEQDRTLHQIPRTLSFGDTGTSADFADYLNEMREAGQDTAVFRLSSRTDCVVWIGLGITRQHQANGVTGGTLVDPFTISPWAPMTVSPNRANGADVTATVTASAKADGPAQVGLREAPPAGGAQGLFLPPRVAVMQPFTLPNAPATSRRFSGLWLCLSGPPAQKETLKVEIAHYDAAIQTHGDILAVGNATLTNRQMDLVAIGEGVFVQWVPFEVSFDVDTPDLAARFALIVSDVSGPIPLLETALGLPQLLPALSRDFARSDAWVKRSFGHPAKALMFELGEIAEDMPASLSVQSGGVTQTYLVPSIPTDLKIVMPVDETLQLRVDREVTLEGITIKTAGAIETLGP